MVPDAVRSLAAWLVGSAILGVAWTVVGFAWWWGKRADGFGPLTVFVRAALGLAGGVGSLLAFVFLTTGTEDLLGNPLGRWSGAGMVIGLWVALEYQVRDSCLVAALAERTGGSVSRWVYAAWAFVVWLAAKAALGFLLLVASLASLQL